MKKIIQINIALIITLLLSGSISNYYIASIFNGSEKKIILFSSNITLLFSSLFVALIYLLVFWFLWNFIKVCKADISHQKFYNIVFIIYSFFILLELSKIIISYMFLKNEIIYLKPNEYINLSIMNTNWYFNIKLINIAELIFLPIIMFLGLKENKIILKHSISLSLLFMLTIFLLGL